jgi:hypothetical protein
MWLLDWLISDLAVARVHDERSPDETKAFRSGDAPSQVPGAPLRLFPPRSIILPKTVVMGQTVYFVKPS